MNKLKVLHICDRYLPQTENWLYQLLRHTPATEQHIAAYTFENPEFEDPEFHIVRDAEDRFKTKIVDESVPRGLRAGYQLARNLRHVVQGSTLSVIANYITQQQIDVIHCHFGNIGYEFVSLKEDTGKPYIVSFYGWDYAKLPTIQPNYRENYRKLFASGDLFLTEGNHARHLLHQLGCPTDKIVIQQLGVQVDTAHLVHPKEAGRLKLVQIASTVPKKGQMDALQAFKQAYQPGMNMQFDLVGVDLSSPLGQQLEKFVAHHQLESVVTLSPPITANKVKETLAQYHAFLHPSRFAPDGDCEGGAPVILLQAQQQGLPVITTDHCDIPEQVKNGTTGMICGEGDISALGEAIKKFYDMPATEFAHFQKSASQWIASSFDIGKNAPKLLTHYQSAIKLAAELE